MANDYSTRGRNGFRDDIAAAPVNVVAPLTGTTVAMAQTDRLLYVNPAGTLAALTIKLPESPHQSERVEIGFSHIITALTIEDALGNAVTGAASAGAVGVAQVYLYVKPNLATTGVWVLWK